MFEGTQSEIPTLDQLMDLIELKNRTVWDRYFERRHVESWLDNFKGDICERDYERRLALWLLLNFVYYNYEEVRHLCLILFKKYIHKRLIESNGGGSTMNERIASVLRKVQFAQLGFPSESSGCLLYYFRQENDLSIGNFHKYFKPEKDKSKEQETEEIAFIDDNTLSGRQADSYIGIQGKNDELANKKISLLTFIASYEAIERLEKKNIEVFSCIKLGERDKCFSTDSIVFRDFPSCRNEAKKISEHYGSKICPDIPLGYSDGQCLFGFFYNTPDNTLPIFWGEKEGWQPILIRHDKKYSKGYDTDERFF